MGNIEDIKKELKEKKILIGTDRVVKNLVTGKLDKIYLSSNCSDDVKKEIKHYSKLNNTKVIQLKLPNDELGAVCKKPFSISVLGVLKA